MSKLILPCGEYAIATVKPKFGALWGLAIGEAKRFFYTKWLPQSDYYAQNLEYEFHTKKVVGKKPTIDIVFATNPISTMCNHKIFGYSYITCQECYNHGKDWFMFGLYGLILKE